MESHKRKQFNYECEVCAIVFATNEEFSHASIHELPRAEIKCEVCDYVFAEKLDLIRHNMKEHTNEKEKVRQYSCEDCALQGENGIELKKHIQRTRHNPTEYNEKCYTCKKEFSSYWHLMNHRKLEHASSKICRYFKLNKCIFDASDCWYKHPASSFTEKEVDLGHACDKCEKVFESKSDLMKHRKTEHGSVISKCRKFAQGNCDYTDSTCWFSHIEQNENLYDNTSNNHETEIKDNFFTWPKTKLLQII